MSRAMTREGEVTQRPAVVAKIESVDTPFLSLIHLFLDCD